LVSLVIRMMRYSTYGPSLSTSTTLFTSASTIAPRTGITPDELVGDECAPTRALADNLRSAGSAGFIVPSAALPGTNNLVLFGARAIHPYFAAPLSFPEVPTGHLSDEARSPAEVADIVR
jgi:hypothetical protein